MDGSGDGFNVDCFRHYFSSLSVCNQYEIRNWVSFFVLYEKICYSAIDFIADHSDVLLSKTRFRKNLIQIIFVVFLLLGNICSIPIYFFNEIMLSYRAIPQLANFARKRFTIIQMEIKFNCSIRIFCNNFFLLSGFIFIFS